MSSHGWRTDSTWGVAQACDNTASFEDTRQSIIRTAALGKTIAAADQLREAVVGRKLLAATLASWVDLADVDWTGLVSAWAQDVTVR